jgi:hypothetical protein
MTALKFLGLVNDEWKTTPKLKPLADAYESAQWQSSLAALVRDSYKAILDRVDLKTATLKMVDDTFKDYGAADAVRKKCVRFFLHAAKEAGMSLSARLTIKARTGAAKKRTSKPKSAAKTPLANIPPSLATNVSGKSRSQIVLEMYDPNEMDEDVKKAVFTLITYLRKKETTSGGSS